MLFGGDVLSQSHHQYVLALIFDIAISALLSTHGTQADKLKESMEAICVSLSERFCSMQVHIYVLCLQGGTKLLCSNKR